MAESNFFTAVFGDPITVNIGAYEFTIAHAEAGRWLYVVSQGDTVAGIIPGMLSPMATDRLYRLLENERVTLEDIRRGALSAIAKMSGFSWWEATRLVGLAEANHGEFFGRLLLKGIDPRSMTFAAWCSATHSLALSSLGDDKEVLKWTTRFSAPPPEASEDEADEGSSFESMVQMARSMPGLRVGG